MPVSAALLILNSGIYCGVPEFRFVFHPPPNLPNYFLIAVLINAAVKSEKLSGNII